ncbi:MAG TPA: hypothetical protein ENL09_03795 [Bacteroidetes bacterium]|nr:hypothetical protein [Bacteroidota bacterium]
MLRDIATIKNISKIRLIEVGEGQPFFTAYFYSTDGKKFLYNVDEIRLNNVTLDWDAGSDIEFSETLSCSIKEETENNFRIASCQRD